MIKISCGLLFIISVSLLTSPYYCKGTNTEREDEDFDLDLIDINTPKKLNLLLDQYFARSDSTIDGSQMLEMMYSFFLQTTSKTIQIVVTKLGKGKELKHSEEDLLSSAYTVEMMLKKAQEDNKEDMFSRDQAYNLLNREKFNEHVQKMADELLKDMDFKGVQEDYDPEIDL